MMVWGESDSGNYTQAAMASFTQIRSLCGRRDQNVQPT
jgi:hypothetical protein